MKTEHFVACTFFQSLVVSRMPEQIKSHTHVCGLRLDDPSHRVVCCLVAHPKSFHLITCFTKHFLAFLTPSHHSVPRTTDYTHYTTADWNQACPLCLLHSKEGSLPTWPEHFLTQDLATQWIQSYSCKNKNFSRDGKEFKKVSRAVRKAESC